MGLSSTKFCDIKHDPIEGGVDMKNPLDSLHTTVALGFVLTVIVYALMLSIG